MLHDIQIALALLVVHALVAPVHAVSGELGADSIVISDVNVIDVRTGAIRAGADVFIAGRKIAKIADHAASAPAPGGGTIALPGRGRFLIPGLWDMHVHLNGEHLLKANLAYGVTTVRVMWGNTQVYAARERIAGHELVGPRIHAASALIDGVPGSWFPFSTVVRTPQDSREAVEKAVAEKADFVKVYSFLGRDLYRAIVAAARGKIPLAGHVPYAVSAAECAASGQRSLEHSFGLAESCCPPARQEAIRTERSARMKAPMDAATAEAADSVRDWDQAQATKQTAGREPDPGKRKALEEKAAALLRSATAHAEAQAKQVQLAYRAAATLEPEIWKCQDEAAAKEFFTVLLENRTHVVPTLHLEELLAKDRLRFEHSALVVKRLSEAGVPLMAGSDEPNAGLQAGLCLHEELACLASAVGDRLRVLQMATLVPARFLGKESSLGTVEVGKDADLVLLEANPLDNIENTRRIAGVIAQGAWHDRATLDRWLAKR